MKRKLMILGLLLTLISGMMVYLNAEADTPVIYNAEDTYERSHNALFYIRVLQGDGSVMAAGTGVVLSSDGTAATAYHVVKGAERIEGTLQDGRVVSPIKILEYDELTDAAILKLPDPAGFEATYASLPIRDTAVRQGEKVYALGYPLKNTPIITEGIINTPKAEINGRNRILTSAQTASGMSGGPIIDQYGRLAGIISGSMRTMNNIHLVIDMSDVRSLLSSSFK